MPASEAAAIGAAIEGGPTGGRAFEAAARVLITFEAAVPADPLAVQ